MIPLSWLDANMVYFDGDHQSMVVGAIISFEHLDDSPQPTVEDVRRHFAEVASQFSDFRSRVFDSPMNLGYPAWVDAKVDTVDHVTSRVIHSDDPERDVLHACEQLMAKRMDLSRPLWDVHHIRTLPDNTVHLLIRVHHAMIDGRRGMKLVRLLMQGVSATEALENPEASPGPPNLRVLILSGLRSALGDPIALLRGLIGAPYHPATERSQRLAPADKPPRLPFNRRLTRDRQVDRLSLPYSDVEKFAAFHYVSRQTALFMLVTAGMAEYVRSTTPGVSRPLRVLFPVIAPRAIDDHTSNSFSVATISLPVHLRDAFHIRRYIDRELTSHGARTGRFDLNQLMAATPPGILKLSATAYRVLEKVGFSPFYYNFIFSTLSGDDAPLTFLGHPVSRLTPVLPISNGAGLAIGIFGFQSRYDVSFSAISSPDVDFESIKSGILRALSSTRE